MKVIVVVDMQNDFVSWQDEAAGKQLVKDIREYLLKELAAAPDTHVIFTMDTHNEDTYEKYFESSTYLIHCINGSKGWNIVEDLANIALDPNTYPTVSTVRKDTYGNGDLVCKLLEIQEATKNPPKEFEVVGLCTDICVLANMVVLNSNFPFSKISLIENLTLGSNENKKKSAIDVMNSMGFNIVTKLYTK